jgi:hypothetical protein
MSELSNDDLEMIHSALSNAAGLAATHDLASQFLAMRQQQRNSALSKQLQTALECIDMHLKEAEDKE